MAKSWIVGVLNWNGCGSRCAGVEVESLIRKRDIEAGLRQLGLQKGDSVGGSQLLEQLRQC